MMYDVKLKENKLCELNLFSMADACYLIKRPIMMCLAYWKKHIFGVVPLGTYVKKNLHF